MSIHNSVLESTGGPLMDTITAPAGPVAATTFEDAPVTLSFATLLAGFADSADATMKIASVTLAAGSAGDGAFTVDKVDQTVTFTPAAGFSGAVVADYSVFDGQGGHTTGVLDLTVAAPSWLGGTTSPIYYGWGDWATGANWTSGVAPSADEAITLTGSAEVLVSTADVALSLTVGQGASLELGYAYRDVAPPGGGFGIEQRVGAGSLTLTHGLDLSGLLIFGADQAAITTPTVTIEAGGALWAQSGGQAQVNGDVVDNSGAAFVGIEVDGDLRITGALTGSGTANVLGGVLEVDGASSAQVALQWGLESQASLPAAPAVLALTDAQAFTGAITLAPGDLTPGGVVSVATNAVATAGGVIDLLNVQVTSASYDGAHLTVHEVGGAVISLAVTAQAGAPSLADAVLTTASDGHGGTDVFWLEGLTQTWNGGDGEWSTPVAWTSGLAPGVYDTASIGGTAAETITVAASDQTAAANALVVTDAAATFEIDGQLTLGVAPTFVGNTVTVTGGLALLDTSTLDHATVLLSGEISTSPAATWDTSGLLTLGPDLTLTQAGATATVVAGSVDNQGTINAGAAGAFGITAEAQATENVFLGGLPSPTGSFTNEGRIEVSNGDQLTIATTLFDNRAGGVIDITGDSSLTLDIPGLGSAPLIATDAGAQSVDAGGGITVTTAGSLASDGGIVAQSVDGGGGSGGFAVGAAVAGGAYGSSLGVTGSSDVSPTWTNEGSISVGAGSTLTLNLQGVLTTAALESIRNQGTVILNGVPADAIGADAQVLTVQGGTLALQLFVTTNTVHIRAGGLNAVVDAGATLEFDHPTSGIIDSANPPPTSTVDLAGPNATLRLENFGDFAGTVNGLAVGDVIDFSDEQVTAVAFGTQSATFTNAFGGQQTFDLDRTFAASQAHLVSDGHGGTELTLTAAAAPVAGAAPTLTAVNGASATLDLAGVVSDPDGLPLSITDVTLESGSAGAGTLSLVQGGDGLTLSYAPAAGFAGSAIADVTVSDGQGGTVVQHVDLQALVQASAPPPPPVDTTTSVTYGLTTTYTTTGPGGVLIGTETVTTTSGGSMSVWYDATGARTHGTVVQLLPGETVTQHFNAAWAQTDASITFNDGAGHTVTQDFDGSWNQIDSTVTTVQGSTTVAQVFDDAWNQQSATVTQNLGGGLVETQHFDADWNQVSASLTQDLGGGSSRTQDFDANWNQVDATLVTQESPNEVVTQHFDANWVQTSATVLTTLPTESILQNYDAHWTLIDSVATLAADSSGMVRVETSDALGNLVSAVDTAADGVQSYFDYSTPEGRQSFTAATDHSITFVLSQGQVNGDTISGLHSLNLGGAIHDVLDFEGFGAGAQLVQVDATHWEVLSTGHAAETFTLSGGAVLAAGDYLFHG